MSVQLIKWVILFVIVCIITPDSCQASTLANPHETQTNNIELIGDTTANALRSLISLFHSNGADLAEEISHTTVDKKAFTYILFYQKYSSLHYPGYTHDTLTSENLLFTGPEQIAYYVYALHRIII